MAKQFDMTPSSASLTVAILAFDNMELLDFAGPYEVFTTASRVAQRQAPERPIPFRVLTVASGPGPVHARAGVRLLPDSDFEALTHRPDILIVPGGVVDAPRQCPRTLEWIRAMHPQSTVTASVCTGAFVLAQAGVLPPGPVTTHWEDIGDLQNQFPLLEVRAHVRWIDNGHIVTSAGISAGIDMCLHLVKRLMGPDLAASTARQMDYPLHA